MIVELRVPDLHALGVDVGKPALAEQREIGLIVAQPPRRLHLVNAPIEEDVLGEQATIGLLESGCATQAHAGQIRLGVVGLDLRRHFPGLGAFGKIHGLDFLWKPVHRAEMPRPLELLELFGGRRRGREPRDCKQQRGHGAAPRGYETVRRCRADEFGIGGGRDHEPLGALSGCREVTLWGPPYNE